MLELLETEAILKAARLGAEETEGERPEAWAEPIEDGFVRESALMRVGLGMDLDSLVSADTYKSRAALGLTGEQIEDIKTLVRQHYLSHIMPDARKAFWNVPDATRRRWESWGIIGPVSGGPGMLAAGIDDMVVAARVAEILEHGTSYRRMREMARQKPETRAVALARTMALQHAGYAVGRLADRHGDVLQQAVFAYANRAALGGMVSEFLAGRLGDQGRSTKVLAAEMRRTLGSPAFERDWRRVAVSETRWAYNYGTLVHYLEEGWRRIYYVVQPTACDHCKRLLLNRDGSPKVFNLDDIIENLAKDGGMNVGRSAALIGKPGGWLPTALIHPWCRCRPMPYLDAFPPQALTPR